MAPRIRRDLMTKFESKIWPLVAYGSYPLTLGICLAGCWWAIATSRNYLAVQGPMMLGILLFYVVLEWRFPLRAEWGMTSRSFFDRDLKFLLINNIVLGLGQIGVGWLAITLAESDHGLLASLPMIAALPLLFLIFEFLHYWHHRLSHELQGRVGRFLWRTHAAHHLPDRVYVLMQPVSHPLDLFTVSIVLMGLLPWTLGISPETTFVFSVLANLHGIVSHLNADLRLGWLNYLVCGPESHRYHHSAHQDEAKNFSAVITIFDHLFGTFIYWPGRHPERLGVTEPSSYPDSCEVGRVIALPFRSGSSGDRPTAPSKIP